MVSVTVFFGGRGQCLDPSYSAISGSLGAEVNGISGNTWHVTLLLRLEVPPFQFQAKNLYLQKHLSSSFTDFKQSNKVNSKPESTQTKVQISLNSVEGIVCLQGDWGSFNMLCFSLP